MKRDLPRGLATQVSKKAQVRKNKKPRVMPTHIVAFDLIGCNKEKTTPINEKGLANVKQELDGFIVESGFSLAGSIISQKTPRDGFSYSANFLESGLYVHCWPERRGTVHVTIWYCNYNSDNANKAAKLQDLIRQYFGSRKTERSGYIYMPVTD